MPPKDQRLKIAPVRGHDRGSMLKVLTAQFNRGWLASRGSPAFQKQRNRFLLSLVPVKSGRGSVPGCRQQLPLGHGERTGMVMERLIRPEPLNKGDTIGICAPSGSFDPEKLDAGLGVLREMGFRLKVADGLFEKKRYLAGDDRNRSNGINALFSDPDVQAVLCARGGFGALRTLSDVDFQAISAAPKRFVGFSDVTALLCAVMGRSRMQVIHGPVVTSLGNAGKETIESLFFALTSDTVTPVHGEAIALRQGQASGILAGGNLATITHLTGTAWQPDFHGCLLFLEDVGEAPYRIERMLVHLKLAGVLSGVSGVLTGSFERCGDQSLIHEILMDIFDDDTVPVIAGIRAGHGDVNLSLPLGRRFDMDAGSFCQVEPAE